MVSEPWLQSPLSEMAGLWQHRRPRALCLVHPAGVSVKPLREALICALMCETGQFPACGHCAQCHLGRSGHHPDQLRLAPTGAAGMISVDAVREAIAQAYTTPAMGLHRVILVSPADALNVASSNALLKTLEEPPETTSILFETARPGRLLPTLVSRLRMIRVPPPRLDQLKAYGEAHQQSAQDLLLGQQLLDEPMVSVDAPDRLMAAKTVLAAMVKVANGQDPVAVARTLAAVDPKIFFVVFEHVCLALMRSEDPARGQRLGFSKPAPEPQRLFQIMDRMADSRRQAEAHIAVNLPLAAGVILSAWSFVWQLRR